MIRILFITLAAMALLPLPMEAQQSPAQRLEAVRASAVQAGIPVELIDNRIAEGRAKGIPEGRIAEAVERRERGLLQAHRVITAAGIVPTAADLSSGTDALEAGVDAESLQAILKASRAQERPVALAVLGELVRQGMPVLEARDRVQSALQRRDENLASLPRETAAERGAGQGRSGAAVPGAAGPPSNPGRGNGNPGQRPTTGPPSGTPGNGLGPK